MKNLILNVPDFPKKGVMFRDISPLLACPAHLQEVVTQLLKGIDLSEIDYIAGIESRGFILGAAMAAKANKGFIPIRKKGKLPPPIESHAYALEYGNDVIEMKPGSGKILLVDDVLATGGTLAAAITLCQKSGYSVQDVSVLIDLCYLNQFTWGANRKVRSVVQYEE